jgi:hypothetical protein
MEVDEAAAQAGEVGCIQDLDENPDDMSTLKMHKYEEMRLYTMQMYPISDYLILPDGRKVRNVLRDRAPQDPLYVQMLKDAADGKWGFVRDRFLGKGWVDGPKLAAQLAHWGAEIQRLAMIPAFTLGSRKDQKMYFSVSFQVWLAANGMIAEYQLGAGSFGTALLVCPAIAPSGCEQIVKIQKVTLSGGKNDYADVQREYAILRYINTHLPDLAPTVRSELTQINDAYQILRPKDNPTILCFTMDRWTGNLYKWFKDHPGSPLKVPENVYAKFIGEVKALFDLDVTLDGVDVRQYGTRKKLRHLTNVDGLTPRNVLYISDKNDNIVRLGIADWGFISDPTDPDDKLAEWQRFVYSRSTPAEKYELSRAGSTFRAPLHKVPIDAVVLSDYFKFNLNGLFEIQPYLDLLTPPAPTHATSQGLVQRQERD